MTINHVECLLCHTVHTADTSDRQGDWRCARCGQLWDASRVAAVLDYQRWAKAETATATQGA